MREMLPKIRTSQHGGDPLWKSEKRRRRSKAGDAVGRARCRSSFLSAPGVEFFAERGRSLDRSMGEYFRRAKVSWDGGDVAPAPRFPVSRGDRKKIQTTASVPKKSVSLQGCTPQEWALVGPMGGGIVNDISRRRHLNLNAHIAGAVSDSGLNVVEEKIRAFFAAADESRYSLPSCGTTR